MQLQIVSEASYYEHPYYYVRTNDGSDSVIRHDNQSTKVLVPVKDTTCKRKAAGAGAAVALHRHLLLSSSCCLIDQARSDLHCIDYRAPFLPRIVGNANQSCPTVVFSARQRPCPKFPLQARGSFDA